MLRPAALGGLFIGILSALPIVGAANCCCCLWIVSGGVLAAYLAGLNQPATLTPGEGAIVGGSAGLIGAFVWIPVALLMDLLMAPLQQAVIGSILSNARDLPPEAREVLEGLGEPSSAGRFVFGFMLMFFGGGVFAAIGGVLAAMFFRKDVPPALGGSAPPPPLADDLNRLRLCRPGSVAPGRAVGRGRIRRLRRGLARWWERRRSVALERLRQWVWAPRPVPLVYDGSRIWLLATSDIERRYRVRNADKEPWTIEWLHSSLQPGEVLYDIGANVGVFSLVGARRPRRPRRGLRARVRQLRAAVREHSAQRLRQPGDGAPLAARRS